MNTKKQKYSKIIWVWFLFLFAGGTKVLRSRILDNIVQSWKLLSSCLHHPNLLMSLLWSGVVHAPEGIAPWTHLEWSPRWDLFVIYSLSKAVLNPQETTGHRVKSWLWVHWGLQQHEPFMFQSSYFCFRIWNATGNTKTTIYCHRKLQFFYLELVQLF